MATFTIESNGRLEKTAVYFNGEQISGIKEIFVNIDEDGTFDAIIQYEGNDKQIHTKTIFEESYLDNVKVVEPSFTESEAAELQEFTVESDGDLGNTWLFQNEEQLDGVVEVLIHIKAAENKNGLKALFSNKNKIPDQVEFKAEITFRNEDDSLETEAIF